MKFADNRIVRAVHLARSIVPLRGQSKAGPAPRILTLLAAALALTVPLRAQTIPASSPGIGGQGMEGRRFETGIVIGGDWLQANALPLDRNVLASVDGSVSFRRQRWAVDVGYLRVARTLSTVQGAYVSGGPLVHIGPVLLLPAIGVLGGQAQVSQDTSGYDWVLNGVSGHTPRYTYSSGATFGGSAGLTVEVPLYRGIGFRALVSEWYFSGAPMEGDRARTLVGAGLSLRVGR